MTAAALLFYVIGERLYELILSRRHARALLARGAHEVGASHYPMMVALHVMWLVAIVGWVAVTASPVVTGVLLLYGLLQGLRFWVMASLGPYWTTRIITLPQTPLVARGPYRYLRHPNYVVVALEIAVLPLVFGAWHIALIFSALNAAMLWVRIRAENAALAERR